MKESSSLLVFGLSLGFMIGVVTTGILTKPDSTANAKLEKSIKQNDKIIQNQNRMKKTVKYLFVNELGIDMPDFNERKE